MKNKLIAKIELEQKILEQEALRQGLKAMGVNDYHTNNIMEHFRWLQSVESVCQEVQTPRTERCLGVARERYFYSLDDGLRSLEKPMTLQHWTNAGKAMNRVFRQAAKEYIRS